MCHDFSDDFDTIELFDIFGSHNGIDRAVACEVLSFDPFLGWFIRSLFAVLIAKINLNLNNNNKKTKILPTPLPGCKQNISIVSFDVCWYKTMAMCVGGGGGKAQHTRFMWIKIRINWNVEFNNRVAKSLPNQRKHLNETFSNPLMSGICFRFVRCGNFSWQLPFATPNWSTKRESWSES